MTQRLMSDHSPYKPKGRRYDMRSVLRARELRDAGWSLAKIGELLGQELDAPPVPRTTVRLWLSEDARDDHAERRDRWRREHRLRSLSGRLPGTGNLSSEFRLVRARALRDAGLSFRAVAVAMSFDFGFAVSEDQVRHALRIGRWAPRPEKAA